MKIEVVVADAGPLHYLALINHASVLEHLFGKILVPEAVRNELLHSNTPNTVKSFINSALAWLQFTAVCDSSKISTGIQRGEAETIQLAIENHVQTVLMDDSQGRKLASSLGFTALGTVGILEIAAARKLLDLPKAFSALRQTNIFVSESILTAALERNKSR